MQNQFPHASIHPPWTDAQMLAKHCAVDTVFEIVLVANDVLIVVPPGVVDVVVAMAVTDGE